MMSTNLLRYLPDFLRSYAEFSAITDAENSEIDKIRSSLQIISENSSVQTCDVERLRYYEKLFGSFAPDGSDIATRRDYLKLALFFRCTPLTERLLNAWLKNMYAGFVQYEIDYENYMLSITMNTPLGIGIKCFDLWLRKQLPANMLLTGIFAHSHNILSKYTHRQLGAYTYDELSRKEL